MGNEKKLPKAIKKLLALVSKRKGYTGYASYDYHLIKFIVSEKSKLYQLAGEIEGILKQLELLSTDPELSSVLNDPRVQQYFSLKDEIEKLRVKQAEATRLDIYTGSDMLANPSVYNSQFCGHFLYVTIAGDPSVLNPDELCICLGCGGSGKSIGDLLETEGVVVIPRDIFSRPLLSKMSEYYIKSMDKYEIDCINNNKGQEAYLPHLHAKKIMGELNTCLGQDQPEAEVAKLLELIPIR